MSNGAPRFSFPAGGNWAGYTGSAVWDPRSIGLDANNLLYPVTFGYHVNGKRVPAISPKAG